MSLPLDPEARCLWPALKPKARLGCRCCFGCCRCWVPEVSKPGLGAAFGTSMSKPGLGAQGAQGAFGVDSSAWVLPSALRCRQLHHPPHATPLALPPRYRHSCTSAEVHARPLALPPRCRQLQGSGVATSVSTAPRPSDRLKADCSRCWCLWHLGSCGTGAGACGTGVAASDSSEGPACRTACLARLKVDCSRVLPGPPESRMLEGPACNTACPDPWLACLRATPLAWTACVTAWLACLRATPLEAEALAWTA